MTHESYYDEFLKEQLKDPELKADSAASASAGAGL